ncbi:conserved hypothetical protein [Trichinella spiralis]|uniref:hypothetical protein n=1 Tax=Trichinella spiralis TaxID=6334 RepID=UPI0001EFC529|nr:conserved hypothetical protein [Trichinella spiralis]
MIDRHPALSQTGGNRKRPASVSSTCVNQVLSKRFCQPCLAGGQRNSNMVHVYCVDIFTCQFLITGRSDYIYFVLILSFVGISFYFWCFNICTKFFHFIYNDMPFFLCLSLSTMKESNAVRKFNQTQYA